MEQTIPDSQADRARSYRLTVPQAALDALIAQVRRDVSGNDRDAMRTTFSKALGRAAAEASADPERYAAWSDGLDIVGTAYERLLSGEQRRTQGQFQTPFWAADLIAEWLLSEPTRCLLDPGVGAGRLLFRAIRHTPPRELIGFDVDPLCLKMADLNLRLRGSSCHELRELNFLLDSPRVRPDAIACNPPYTRHRVVPSLEKQAIHDGFQQRLGVSFSRMAGLHALFLVRAVEIAAPNARIAFITPASWLDVNYGSAIKRWVLDHAHVEALVVLPHDHLFFTGALTTAAITLLRKTPHPDAPTKLIQLGKLPDEPHEVLRALRGETTSLGVERLQLSPDMPWHGRRSRRRAGTPLGELARVSRGIATGNNKFFVLSERGRREHGLALTDVRACLATPRLVSGTQIVPEQLAALPDDTPRWIIAARDPSAEHADNALGRYLRHGRDTLGAADSYLARSRRPWFAPERRGKCAILFTYFNRDRARFIRNRCEALPLNTFIVIEPHEGIDADSLWAALNRSVIQRELEVLRRNYGGGLWKLEPSELRQVRVTLPARQSHV